ncbi:MAG: hypothetical protein JSW12_01545 [Deltaproteobacteria bacterium]|nr:MAG: hypothetical protein JSW12_01545 [Deltaproteobacteria bacterium]
MERDIIAMGQRERQRFHLLEMVIGGKTTLKGASMLMGVSYRHAKRLKKKLISEGAKGTGARQPRQAITQGPEQ